MLYFSSATSPLPDWQLLQIAQYPKYQFQVICKTSPHDPGGILFKMSSEIFGFV